MFAKFLFNVTLSFVLNLLIVVIAVFGVIVVVLDLLVVVIAVFGFVAVVVLNLLVVVIVVIVVVVVVVVVLVTVVGNNTNQVESFFIKINIILRCILHEVN